MNSIETVDLNHRFSENHIALDRLNLKVPRGTIYGFLGPNGAGKTTTLKLILGLLKKQSGSIFVLGKPFAENRLEILRQVGSMIESPSLYEHLSATENLQVLQKVYRCKPQRINEVLELVNLSDTGKKRAGQFSLGMKQRLSIACALLHEPSLIILDEPTNGLDPNGILEIRELLKTLNQTQGITILVSSHLLSEIERLVTHIGIISRGVLKFQGTLPELMNVQRKRSYITFSTDDSKLTADIIHDGGIEARIDGMSVTLPVLENDRIAHINRRLVERGIAVSEIKRVDNDLEKIFFDVIDS